MRHRKSLSTVKNYINESMKLLGAKQTVMDSRVANLDGCSAHAFLPAYWQKCPRAGTVPLAFVFCVPTLTRWLQPQTVAVRPIAPPIVAPDHTGISNALANHVTDQTVAYELRAR
jgi:hypothetical protein